MTETFPFSKTDFVGVTEAENWPPIWRKDVFKQCPESKILFLGLKGEVLTPPGIDHLLYFEKCSYEL